MWRIFLCLTGAVLAGCGGRPQSSSGPGSGEAAITIKLTSTAFREGETIPKEFTADGKSISPPLQWAPPPQGTKSLVLICDDPDAPSVTWVHWVLYDLPPETRSLEQGTAVKDSLANGAKQCQLAVDL